MAAALAFAAVALAVGGLGSLAPRRARSARGASSLRLLTAVGARLRGQLPRTLSQRITAAGLPATIGPRELMAAKVGSALLGTLAGSLAAGIAPGRLWLPVVAAGPVAGFLAPDGWLARRATARIRAARRELPALLDLLRVTVEAGVAPAAALGAVGERASGLVAAEWRAVSREASLGVPLHGALAAMAERLPAPELRALVSALDRALRHGAPLADTLAAQARDARLAQRRQIEEEAARAGPKIQLVVALLLVPSVLLLVAAALAAALLEGGGPLPIGP
ncbi:MAG: tight adherence protein [Thermoleophilaceae bacterium]|nr:tight adherence protein [Thermoleophilaceae bacterium]